jgi:UDP-N-acetylglucosamine--N-acetylmuramyl-(pentapeptide) pyrophosphoryl-undecaprenol N-acetylglucosamine transferase
LYEFSILFYMKIVFTGGQTGGHFYPIISVVQDLRKLMREEHLIEPQMYFMAPDPYNRAILFDNNITYKRVMSGKQRIYPSILNFTDKFKILFGIIEALWKLFWIYPDIVFSKGGYGSVPVVFAAKMLGIPIIVHESDSAPGRANLWASKFATKIAVSYPEAAHYFDEKKVAWTGNPVRDEIKKPILEGAHAYLQFDPNIKTILILGGSQGAQIINNMVIDTLPQLVEEYQIIHQTGKNNYKEVKETSNLLLQSSPLASRYSCFPYLNDVAMKMSAGAADLIISRAGSTIFEIASWNKPSIIIPITDTNNDHQKKNAYNYARAGACIVIEENNLTPEIFIAEINRLINRPDLMNDMSTHAAKFSKADAGRLIARQIIDTLVSHEK